VGVGKMKKVYIIMSSEGGILLNFQGVGTCYSDIKKSKEALKSKNEWSKSKGYGVYELVTLEVQE